MSILELDWTALTVNTSGSNCRVDNNTLSLLGGGDSQFVIGDLFSDEWRNVGLEHSSSAKARDR